MDPSATAPMSGATATRPGGRTAAVRAAVLSATEDALIASGFAHLDLPAIAARAGVGKTTIYRRWGTAQALVSDLLTDMAAQSVDATASGSLDDDLRANADLLVRTLTDPRQGPLFAALIAASTHDDDTKRALAGFYDTRVREWTRPVRDAIDRGDIPAATDPVEVVRHISAPLYYRFITSTTPLTTADADSAVRATLAALHAGVFTTDEG
ncbi:TetR/AcrR family transcriptional regulator C-terminal ligand-binding domain-containing protein [Williamsia sp. SKLECPSW1]